MPFGFQISLDFHLNSLLSFCETWSKYPSGRIATSLRFFPSRKCSIGGSSFWGISFSFPLSTTLSGQRLLNDQFTVPNEFFLEIGVGSLAQFIMPFQYNIKSRYVGEQFQRADVFQ